MLQAAEIVVDLAFVKHLILELSQFGAHTAGLPEEAEWVCRDQRRLPNSRSRVYTAFPIENGAGAGL